MKDSNEKPVVKLGRFSGRKMGPINRVDRLSGRYFLDALVASVAALLAFAGLLVTFAAAVGLIIATKTGMIVFIVVFIAVMYRIAYLASKGEQ